MKIRKPNHCICCGKYIEGIKYNPYNVTFDHYHCEIDEKKMCLNCAEKFVKTKNKYKGGVWEVLEWKENNKTYNMQEMNLKK